MGLKVPDLKPLSAALYNFTRGSIQPLGSIQLALTVENFPRQCTIMTELLVINRSSKFNAVIGRPSLGELRAVTSIHHLMVKFPTPKGIGCMQGELQEAHECYNRSITIVEKDKQPE